MSKADYRKIFCETCMSQSQCGYYRDNDGEYCPMLKFYDMGYRQAEKDLELTWEDIPKILHICEQLKTRWWFRDDEQTKQIGRQPFWEEVLKRFKAMKDNESK